MRRRNFLRFTGVAGALAVAGCVGGDSDGSDDQNNDETESTPTPTATQTPTSDEDTGEESSGEGSSDEASNEDESSQSSGEYVYEEPTAAVEAFVQAFHDSDVDGFFALTYDEGELDFSRDDIDEQYLTNNAPEIEEIELAERDGDTATVEVELVPPDADSSSQSTFELRLADGGWRIASISQAEPQGEMPRASFEVEVQQGTATIVLEAGESIPAGELYVRGDGIEPTGVWHELAEDSELGPDDMVGAGMAVSVDVDDEYSIQIVWESDDQSATLLSASGASNSESATGTERVDEYLSDTDNYDGTIADMTGKEAVTVTTGDVEDSDPTFAFDPPAIRIDAGTTVTWEWAGDAGHSVTHEEEMFNSEVMSGDGTTFEHTFEETRTYLYHCIPHKALGMKGAVVVE
jgi:halocyanin-like protein